MIFLYFLWLIQKECGYIGAMNFDLQEARKSLSKPITMIGMMGTGKTHMGRLLAQKLAWPFFDSDNLVEEKAGCPISVIFDIWGEQKFRDVEARTIRDLLSMKRCVIATGGGAIMNGETADAIFNQSSAVWVQADIDTILNRVSKNKNRPLLACENPKDVLQKLMEQRKDTYARAPFTLDSTKNNDEGAALALLEDIYNDVMHGAR